jgi:16S rRNA (uracil1498-N3)-methyltransferase
MPHPDIENGLLSVKGPEVRHIRKVLRLRVGEVITVFDGEGKEYEGKIVKEGPTSVFVKIERFL